MKTKKVVKTDRKARPNFWDNSKKRANPDLALHQDDALPLAMHDAIARGKKIQATKISREATESA